MNIRSRVVLLALLAVGASTAPQAQDTPLINYDVELVIFRVNRPGGTAENWMLAEKAATARAAKDSADEDSPPAPRDPTATTTESAAPANTNANPSTETSFPAIAPAQFRMHGIEESLRKSRNYQLLAHIGWMQPGFPLSVAPTFSLQDHLPSFLPDGVKLTGQASLGRGQRLLHLTLDLTYQTPDGQRFVLREERVMRRSGEKHYFDHPYFGVVALVTSKDK